MTVWAILWTICILLLWVLWGYEFSKYEDRNEIIDMKTKLAMKDMRCTQLMHTVKDYERIVKKMKKFLRTDYYHDMIETMIKNWDGYKRIAKNLWLKENTVFKYIKKYFK